MRGGTKEVDRHISNVHFALCVCLFCSLSCTVLVNYCITHMPLSLHFGIHFLIWHGSCKLLESKVKELWFLLYLHKRCSEHCFAVCLPCSFFRNLVNWDLKDLGKNFPLFWHRIYRQCCSSSMFYSGLPLNFAGYCAGPAFSV